MKTIGKESRSEARSKLALFPNKGCKRCLLKRLSCLIIFDKAIEKTELTNTDLEQEQRFHLTGLSIEIRKDMHVFILP